MASKLEELVDASEVKEHCWIVFNEPLSGLSLTDSDRSEKGSDMWQRANVLEYS